jgi:hypothetical protein
MKNRDEVYGAAKQERSLEKGKTAKLSSKRISFILCKVRMELACTADSANQIYTTEKQLPSAPSSQKFEEMNLRRQKVHMCVRTLCHVTDILVCHSGDTLDLFNITTLKDPSM